MAVGLPGSRWREGGPQGRMAPPCWLPQGPWAGLASPQQVERTVWLGPLVERLNAPRFCGSGRPCARRRADKVEFSRLPRELCLQLHSALRSAELRALISIQQELQLPLSDTQVDFS